MKGSELGILWALWWNSQYNQPRESGLCRALYFGIALVCCFFFSFLNTCIYLFIWLCWFFVSPCRIFSCGMWTLSCCMWDLVPWSGIEPALRAQSYPLDHQGSPSLACCALLSFECPLCDIWETWISSCLVAHLLILSGGQAETQVWLKGKGGGREQSPRLEWEKVSLPCSWLSESTTCRTWLSFSCLYPSGTYSDSDLVGGLLPGADVNIISYC